MSGITPCFSKDINDKEYTVYRLQMAKWAELTEMLSDLLGEPLASLLNGDAVLPEGADTNALSGDVFAIVAGIAKKLTAKTIMKMPQFMGVCLHCDGVPLGSKKQETWWPSNMKDLAPVIRFFLEVQYADFLEGLNDST